MAPWIMLDWFFALMHLQRCKEPKKSGQRRPASHMMQDADPSGDGPGFAEMPVDVAPYRAIFQIFLQEKDPTDVVLFETGDDLPVVRRVPRRAVGLRLR